MSRGRKPLTPAEQAGPTFVGKTPEAMAIADQDMATNQAAMEDTLVLGRFVGRVEMIDAYQTWGNAAKVAAFETAKNSKAYRFLINPRTKTYFGSLDEFCEVAFGNGYERMRQLIGNRNAVSLELFEQSERLGLRQIDYNAIKALPAPEQELVQQAIKESVTREEVLDLLQELAARHHREREEKDKKIANLTEEGVAKDRLIEDKDKKINQLDKDRRKTKPDPWPAEVGGLKDDLAGLGKVIDEAMSKHLTLIDAFELEFDQQDEGSDAHNGYKSVIHHFAAAIERICTLAAGLRYQYDTRLAGYIELDKTFVLPEPDADA